MLKTDVSSMSTLEKTVSILVSAETAMLLNCADSMAPVGSKRIGGGWGQFENQLVNCGIGLRSRISSATDVPARDGCNEMLRISEERKKRGVATDI